jgi:hypothetical protein
MKLTYNILWFEDSQEFVELSKKEIENILDELGLELLLEHQIDGNGFKINPNISKTYDLILTDLNLSENHTEKRGQHIIEELRKGNIYTEVLFYSGNATEIQNVASELAKELGILQRISLHAGRQGLIDKIENIINLSLKKFQEVNPMRGLFMAETSDMDELMREVAIQFEKIHKDKVEVVINYIKKIMLDSLKANTNSITEITTLKDLIMHPICDSIKKAKVILKIGKLLMHSTKISVDDFQKDITNNRNILGHVKLINENNKEVLKSHFGGKELEITDEFCIEARKNLKKYKDLLTDIKNMI